MIPTGLYNFVRVATLFVFGYALINIFHFCIEDTFNLPILHPFIMGKDYASPLSYAIVCFLAILVLEFCEKSLIYKPTEAKLSEVRQKWDGRMMAVCFVAAGLICAAVLYRYLSGITDERGLYRILVTLGVLFAGSLYGYVNILRDRGSLGPIGGVAIALSLAIALIASSYVALTMAPPREMALLRKDIESFERFKDLARVISDKRHDAGSLLQDQAKFDSVLSLNTRTDGHGDNFGYSRITNEKFKLCVTFRSKAYNQIRRIAYMTATERHYIKKGQFCATYRYVLGKRGTYSKEMIAHHHGDEDSSHVQGNSHTH